MRTLKIIGLILVLAFAGSILSGCFNMGTLYFVDRYNIGGVTNDYDFANPEAEKYTINGTFLIPYIYAAKYAKDRGFKVYELSLESYQKRSNPNKVTINHVEIKGMQDVIFKDVKVNINKMLRYRKPESSDVIKQYEGTLIHELNSYDMKINKSSQLRITLNVSIDDGNEIITQDIVYDFETK